MVIGSLGEVVFKVSYDQLLTFQGLTRTRTIKNARHDVLEGLPRLQHTGRDLDTITMTVVLERMKPGDTSPDESIESLLALAETGDEVALVLGKKYLAMWFLESLTVNHKEYHQGITWRATVDLNLVEYN